jgi:hypothetical protein
MRHSECCKRFKFGIPKMEDLEAITTESAPESVHKLYTLCESTKEAVSR